MKINICPVCGKKVFLYHDTPAFVSDDKQTTKWQSCLFIREHLNDEGIPCKGSYKEVNVETTPFNCMVI